MGLRWKKAARRFWQEWVKPLLVVAIVLFSFRSAIADWNDVPSSSMRPTILPGDRVFVNKVAYDLRVPFSTIRIGVWGQPERGDIIVFDSPRDGKRLVKRVIGVPGDQIEMRDYRLYVDGKPVRYELAGPLSGEVRAFRETLGARSHVILTNPTKPFMPSFLPVKVPDASYVVMGDNRDNSFDSRGFGYVKRERIFGEVTGVVLSIDLDNYYLPRWERFFSSLD